jgi:hypothetical protein
MKNILDELNAEIGKKNYSTWCKGVDELYKLYEWDSVKHIAEYSVHHYRIFMQNGRVFDFYPSNYKFGDIKNAKWWKIKQGNLLHTIHLLNK